MTSLVAGAAAAPSAPRRSTCVITGATSGIGRSAARMLARRPATLFFIGRNARAGEALARRLTRPARGTTATFLRADLSCQADVRSIARRIADAVDAVDVLINNAGARIDRYIETADGLEATFATNHLSHFLLTHLLIDRLAAAPAARVITVSSSAHASATADGPWREDARTYDRRRAYARSKLANVLFAYELARRAQGTRISSNAVDPGLVATNFARNNGWWPWLRHLASHALRRELTTARRAAETVVYLATADEVVGRTGQLYYRKHPIDSSPASHDRDAARRLWELSAGLTGLTDHPWAQAPARTA
jgi:NAD(P)-dependent dehydrogenase (short-subunit alcohol dehydrogenase family)